VSLHRLHYCPDCLRKQQEIDRLREENARLKANLRYQQRTAKEAPFGSGTSSAKQAVKANSLEENQRKKGGAQPGHRGAGRRRPRPQDITRHQTVPGPTQCPDCGGPLVAKGAKTRIVIDAIPVQREVIAYEVERCACPHCRRVRSSPVPGVFPKSLLGNRLLAYVAFEHYVHGTTLGRLARQLRLPRGTLGGALHELACRLEPALAPLVQAYRRAPVKHADETGWRNDGRNGYAWLFCTERLSLFRFRQSRAARVAQEVLGRRRLAGTLVVDRYPAYNRAPCALQYCYAHLLREVEALGKEFPGPDEVQRFVQRLAPLLAQAMRLRTQGLPVRQFRKSAAGIKAEIQATVTAGAQHPGIQKLQNLFRENAARLYRWARHPNIPAENNRAERELRPLVIARKISFGSQSERGLQTREVLMSVLLTLNKQTGDGFEQLTQALDALAKDPTRDPHPLLFNSS
jgi:transposase